MPKAGARRKAEEASAKQRLKESTAQGKKGGGRGGATQKSSPKGFAQGRVTPSSPSNVSKKNGSVEESQWNIRNREREQREAEERRKREAEKALKAQQQHEENVLNRVFRLNAKPCVWAGECRGLQSTLAFLTSLDGSFGADGHTRNCRDNPLCIRGFGEFREGIWAHSDGDQIDPSDTLRTAPFVGLKVSERSYWKVNTKDNHAQNLGATCYLNTMLQCLFMNHSFRQAVYQCPTAFEDKVTFRYMLRDSISPIGRRNSPSWWSYKSSLPQCNCPR